jgi:uncharacterized protein YbjT (DUF2867 family)
VLVEGARRLLEAEQRVGVHHHVCVSMVGIEDVPFGYYRVNVEQERVVQQGGVAWSIVRSTQFHDLLGAMLWALARLAGGAGEVPAGRRSGGGGRSRDHRHRRAAPGAHNDRRA